jgi:hypothetical protein
VVATAPGPLDRVARRDRTEDAARVAAPTPGRHWLAVRIVRPMRPLDSPADASNTPAMDDPLVAALAQLVRDRWAAERRERARLVVVEGSGHATSPRHG